MTDDIPTTGPEAIMHALQRMDLDAIEKEQRQVITDRKKTKRPRAVRLLNIIAGLRKNEMQPSELMVHSVPVIPPKFRPFSVTGNTFLPGDANELYRDLMEYQRLYNKTEEVMGRGAAGEVYEDLNKAVRAVYGYGESPNPKTRARKVKGFFTAVTGTNPKTSWLQSKMLSKPVDTVGRGVIVPDADLGMDEIGIPEEMGWKQFGNYVQRRLVRSGMSAPDALRHLVNRTPQARKALEMELPERPIVLTRSPSWIKTGVIGQIARLVPGDAIQINNFVSAGLGADFDGDTVSIHTPSSDETVKNVREKLMASHMLWSTKDRDTANAIPKHESVLGLSLGRDSGGKKRYYDTDEDAMAAIDSGEMDLNDDVEIGTNPNQPNHDTRTIRGTRARQRAVDPHPRRYP